MTTISPTQSNVQAALRAFLLAVLPAIGTDGNPVSVIAAVANRVPEPQGTDFALMTVLRDDRLSTNVDSLADARFTGSIAPASASFTGSIAPGPGPGPGVLTVSAVTSGVIVAGAPVAGPGVSAGTIVGAQLSGSTGGIGTYAVAPTQTAPSAALTSAYGVMTVSAVQIGQVNAGATIYGVGVAAGTAVASLGTGAGGVGTYNVVPSQAISSSTLSAGQKTMVEEAEFVVQVDFHSGANVAADMAKIAEMMLRDDFGVDFFAALAPPLNGVVPLYADGPRYIPFINESNQYEHRWVLDVHLQVNQAATVGQQYADAVAVGLQPVF